MDIRQLDADDWETYRDIRLASLAADPGAFASTHEREAAFDEAIWRLRLTTGPLGKPNAVFLTSDESGKPAGTATVAYTEHHPAPMLVAMWVDPLVRGRRIGASLVEAAVAWATERGDEAMVLWVVRDNATAIALYERCGFAATGNTDTLPSNPCAEELEMLRPFGSAELSG